ncbi:MAG: site-specific DNA-methyltransferase [Bacteroidetes bacterium]|nr:site-specific DNA-methyltransferase [Bacteroidota bacterium]
MIETNELLSIKEASNWASEYLKKDVTTSNISYLIQYGRIKKHGDNGNTLVCRQELIKYYKSFNGKRETDWREILGKDLNWTLSFDHLKESDTTKHVHRLHPYKGKFIPQLVEYFLDDHTDNFKTKTYFKKGDIVFDPFCGSGTTLIQANELGMHAVGTDISAFNSLITNVKITKCDFADLHHEIKRITTALKQFIYQSNNLQFENELLEKLNIFNNKYFPSPEFKIKVHKGEIDEKIFCPQKENEFLPIFERLIDKYKIQIKQESSERFLEKWFLQPIKNEIDFVYKRLNEVENPRTKNILTIVLSRTVRSCRATTHADLATLKEPVTTTYFCRKHGKICKPLFSILSWWERYCKDTLKRLSEFNQYRTATHQACLLGDARQINLFSELEKKSNEFAELAKKQKIKGIFSSPPYVGLIDYHEQHAYAYDLFGFERSDQSEIGPLYKGQGREARESYVIGVSDVLVNCKQFLSEDYNVFLVANDKYRLYPTIARLAEMKIVNEFKRPVLHRTEKNKTPYSETIFHIKEASQ